MGDPGPTLRFQVLGTLRAWRDDRELPLGPAQQRVILAVLLLRRGRALGRDPLVGAVWGAEPPAYAVNLLQQSVARLRRILEPGRPPRAPSRLLTWTETGYLLAVPAAALDLTEFEREASRGRAARDSGDLADAAVALRRAAELWQGPLCDGLISPFLASERNRLNEARLAAVADRIEVALALQPGPELVDEARRLTAGHPLWERAHELLMAAHYRAGDRAGALTAYRSAREVLSRELGVEPSGPLQRLHRRILDGRPLTDPGGGAVRQRPVPAQLPPAIGHFTARAAELARLDDAAAAATGAMVVTAVGGAAGVGKTALAVHWAHRVRDRFPDGQLYVDLHGFDAGCAAAPPEDVLLGFLDALGVPPQGVPPGLAARSALYRSLLAGRRILVVLDNAQDSAQARPLLPGTPGCVVLVTSRTELTALLTDGAELVQIDVLSERDARELLARRLGRARVAAELPAVDSIVAACARLPLALTVVAARAAAHPRFPLAAVAGELREGSAVLDVPAGEGDRDVRAVLSWSYERLTEPARRLFRLLGLHHGADVGRATAASLAAEPLGRIRKSLDELTRAYLLTEHVPGRYTRHDLLRAYASELVADDPERAPALHRLLDHYVRSAFAADRSYNAHRDDPVRPRAPAEGVVVDASGDQEAAKSWFATEQRALLAVHADAARLSGAGGQVWRLAWALSPYLEYRGAWTDWADVLRRARDAADETGETAGRAVIRRLLGCRFIHTRDFAAARACLRDALELYAGIGDRAGQAHTHRHLAWMLNEQERYPEALPHVEQALALFRAAGNGRGQGRALNAIGWFHARLGDDATAVAYCEQALELQRRLGDQYGEGETLDSLGLAYAHLGSYPAAVRCYRQARQLYARFGNRFNEADTLVSLGDVQRDAGELGAARQSWQEALGILEQLDQPGAEPVRARLAKWASADPDLSPGGSLDASPGGEERRDGPIDPSGSSLWQ